MILFIDKNNVIFKVISQSAMDTLYYAEGLWVVTQVDMGI